MDSQQILGLDGDGWHYIQVSPEATSGISTIKAAKATADKVYNLQGQQQKSLQKGINIIKMNNGSVKKVMVK